MAKKVINYRQVLNRLGVVLLAFSLAGNIFLLKHQSTVSSTHLVTEVLDGDTFVTEDKSIIRFDSLDAPEIGRCGSLQAKQELEKLILGKRVKIEAVVRDPTGRVIATVWQGSSWVDEKLIASGWVKYASTTIEGHGKLKSIDDQNEILKIGIHSNLCTQYENAYNPKCNIKGNIVDEWTNRGEKIYHLPGCAQYKSTRIEKYRGEEWFCSEKEAVKAGYTKSQACP